MEISKADLDKRLQEILNYFDFPIQKRRDYRWLRQNIDEKSNSRDYQEAKALIIKLLEIENKERLKFMFVKK